MCLNCLGGDTDKCLINVYYHSGVSGEEVRLRQAVGVDAVVSGREITAPQGFLKTSWRLGMATQTLHRRRQDGLWAVCSEVELLPAVHMALDSVPRATNGL